MKKMCGAVAAFLLLTGCVIGASSPFYTDDLIVKQPELYGSWLFTEDIEAHDESPLDLAEGRMTIYDDKGVPASAKATFFKIDGVLFIDIFADEGKLKHDLVGPNDPVHLLSRIKILGPDKISFNALDYDWLDKQIEAGAIQLPYTKRDNDLVFTATSVQWVEFLRAHKEDTNLFPPLNEATLVRRNSSQP